MQNAEQVNILLVDDQPAKLMSYEAVLAELGERLLIARSAREALEQLLRNEVAVILVDVCMPELDGFQLAEMIRDHPRFRDTAIVFISAVQLDDYDRLRAYQLGAVDYVPVPIIPELLRAKVKVFAELYRKTRELERLNRELEARVAARTAELEAANARLELAIDVARLGTWDLDYETGDMGWSERYCALLGYAPGEVEPTSELWARHLHPAEAETEREHLAAARDSGAEYHRVYRCVRADGTIIWCEARGRVTHDASGKPRGLRGVVMDISEHKLAEERQHLMVQELHHRVKNSLTSVQAIAGLTARSAVDVPSFYQAFSARLQSLSRTHTMLVAHNWRWINIEELLGAEIGSFQDGTGRRFSCAGPSIDLPSEVALSLGLAVHELTTNSIKYGALSVPPGHVEINWTGRPVNRGIVVLELNWVERGGPPVGAPVHQGFGMKLLEKIFASQCGGETRLEFQPEGLKFHAAIHFRATPGAHARARDGRH